MESHQSKKQGGQPLRVGIAGLGRLGARHAQALAYGTRHCTLVAACSPVAAERAYAAEHCGVQQLYENLDDMLANPDIDAVALVTPTSMHAGQTIAALRAGKHVFVEKPLALNVEDCEAVLKVAEQHLQQVAMVGFVRRFDPHYQAAQRVIAQGEIGRPFIVNSQTCDLNDPEGFFVRFAPTSGGIFMDCSIHDIDLARWMLGKPRALRVFASGTNALHPALAEHGDVDNGLAMIEFEGGARAVLYASRTMAHGHETSTEIIGTAGKLQIGEHGAKDRILRSDGHGVRHAVLRDFYERFEAAFQAEMAAFVAACRGEKALELELADAVEATRIGLAITKAYRTGQVVEVG
ncbi:Gfo/Idh/MocA family oxidoreductase [Paucibacter sp. R3-3]|uniref:Gfo/Idh/MocA family oxidoreductase n=1 Tax=Roseateles agri TaxID=3098619 RepID=A0ABU5DGW7_9BURK|nr:Gfo/Idh/MocA family oxidoreductase [Paucibacter sp. R3-3]MDY0745537.1 Gfo/Idh/MocA family oxidoreductase [Paucibacter sp. R3-3]